MRIAVVGGSLAGLFTAKAAADALALRNHLSSKPLGDALRDYGQERVQAGATIAASGRELGAHLE